MIGAHLNIKISSPVNEVDHRLVTVCLGETQCELDWIGEADRVAGVDDWSPHEH